MSVWKELGIERTDNMREIKRAYAAKLKLVHPEEHPKEFQELHEAYKLALNIAKYHSNMPKRQDPPAAEKIEKSPVAEKAEQGNVFDFTSSGDKSDEEANDDTVNNREKQFDFDKAIRRNALKHDNEVMEKAEIVLKKVADLYNKKLFDNKQDWIDIFDSASVDEIRYEPIFIRELCRFLKSHKISENMANAIFSSFKLFDYMIYYDNSEIEDLYNLIIGAKGESLNRLEASVKLFKIFVFLFTIAFFLSWFTGISLLAVSIMACLGGSIIGLIVSKEKRKKFYE
mgnify:CR=1 FL=1